MPIGTASPTPSPITDHGGSGPYDVAIAGAGVVGLAAAFELARHGARVVVIEADHPGSGASTVAAGMLAPGHEAHADPLLRELGLHSHRLWPSFAEAVERVSGLTTGYVGRGIAVLATDPGEADELAARASERAAPPPDRPAPSSQGAGTPGPGAGAPGTGASGPAIRRGEQTGLSPADPAPHRAGSGVELSDAGCGVELSDGGFRDPVWLAREDLPAHLAVFPGACGALFFPEGGHVDPVATVRALAAALAASGVTLLPGTRVHGWRDEPAPGGRRLVAALTTAGEIRASWFVLAGGVYNATLAAQAGFSLPVVPVKGQILAVEPPASVAAFVRGQVPVFGGSVYLVPRRDGRLLIGATEEPEAGYDTGITLGAIGRLATAAQRLLPELAGARWLEARAGLRPGTPDKRPIIGRAPGFVNALVAAGHYRNGILLAPLTARIVAVLCAGKASGRSALPGGGEAVIPAHWLEALRPERFAQAPPTAS